MTHITGGVLIVFEGIDGTGKSTQLELLHNSLEKNGYLVTATREPTSGIHGQKIRTLYQNRSSVSLKEELELFLADRKEHVDTLIAPALAAGKIVLCDRYYLSTAAYQGAAGMDPESIIRSNSFAPEPDLALIFEIDVAQSIRRIIEKRGDILNDFEQLESLKKVDTIFKNMKFDYITRIDASGTIEQIRKLVRLSVLATITQKINNGSQEKR